MRIAILIALIVFCASNSSRESAGRAYTGGICCSAEGCACNVFTVYHTEFWKTGSEIVAVSFLEKLRSQFIVIGHDTTRFRGASRNVFDPVHGLDTGYRLASSKIYDRKTLPSVFHSTDENSRWLVYVQDTDLVYVGPATISGVQLDNDATNEYIVQVMHGWYHSYLIYDSTASGWQLKSQISLGDRGDFRDVDLNLPGYIGLTMMYSGTGLNAADIHYVQLSDKVTVSRFTINNYYGQSLGIYRTDSALLCFNSESDVVRLRDGIIRVRALIKLTLFPLGDVPESVFHTEVVEYNLIRNNSGKFDPDKNLPGFLSFCTSEYCDSTYFAPEAYAYSRLSDLKQRGTKVQRNFLREFKFDSTAYFR